MRDTMKRDSGIADRSDYERIVVESDFPNGCRITVSKEPDDDQFFVYFEILGVSDARSIGQHKKTLRVTVDEAIEAISDSVRVLERCAKNVTGS